MAQTEMLEVLEVCEEAAHVQRAVEEQKWANWGRDRGTLTREQIRRMAQPKWQWDDYSI